MLTNIDTQTETGDSSTKHSPKKQYITSKVIFFYIRGRQFELGIRNYKSMDLGKSKDLIRLNTYDNGFNRLIDAS